VSRAQGAVIVAVSFVALIAALLVAAPGHRVEIKGLDGTVYVESNSSAPNSNEILAFHLKDASLRPRKVDRYPTGGSGSHDLDNLGVLDSDQEIVTNPQRTLLFAVNASSDTIAVFHIAPGGALSPVKGSPFPSNGKGPQSLGLAGDTLIVANKAQDGVRDLSSVPANYSSFKVAPDGALSRPISSFDAPPRSSPLQVYVTPNRKVVIASEESGVFRAFRILPGGRLVQGPNSPLPLDDAVFPARKRIANNWPAGLVSHPTQKVLYAQVANVSRTIVYRWDDDARLTFIRAMPNLKAFLPCWTKVNAAGTRMYSGNAGSNNMSVFDITGDATAPRQVQSVKLKNDGNPWNFELDPSGRALLMLDMRAVKQVPAGQGNELHVLRVEQNGHIKEFASSPVKIPVPRGTNPYGLAIKLHH
jgi:6-phosphogluconolactonase (cycloisomerase 2 family)